MAATATFVIDFGGVDDAFLVAELDSDKNNGKTKFQKGDVVHFRVYSDVNYTIETTSGTVIDGVQGMTQLIQGEALSFIKGDPASVSKKIADASIDPAPIKASTWYGTDLGQVNKVDNTSVQAVNADKTTLGVASIDYLTDYNEHSIMPPANMTDVWHILVYIKAIP